MVAYEQDSCILIAIVWANPYKSKWNVFDICCSCIQSVFVLIVTKPWRTFLTQPFASFCSQYITFAVKFRYIYTIDATIWIKRWMFGILDENYFQNTLPYLKIHFRLPLWRHRIALFRRACVSNSKLLYHWQFKQLCRLVVSVKKLVGSSEGAFLWSLLLLQELRCSLV